MFSRLVQYIRQVIHRMFPFKDVEQAEKIETPLSNEMITELDLWHDMYIGRPPWLSDVNVKSLNIPALVCSEIARQVTLELKWNISGKTSEGDDADVTNPRSEYLKTEFKKLMDNLRMKLEQGCAAGGMTIKPYPKDGHIFFDCSMAWSLFPVSFGDDGNLTDVVFRDTFQDGKTTYTRLERHTVTKDGIKITQRAFSSQMRDSIGSEIPLSDVPQWAGVSPEATLQNTDGQMFGWYKVASANNIDVDSPMGVSAFCKATDVIKQADLQYSRLLWEFEGSELAIDVDPTALRPKPGDDGKMETPRLNDRLFRGVDLNADDTYKVFNPAIRDTSLLAGLNQLMMRIEDLCGLARGTLSDQNSEARTATELRIIKQRTYATIADNQAALERCLRDVVRAMDKYASIYNLAPEGDYELSFEWDDSILTDATQQLGERLQLLAQGLMGKVEMRQWYFGETKAQAEAALEELQAETPDIESLLPSLLTSKAQPGKPAAKQPASKDDKTDGASKG